MRDTAFLSFRGDSKENLTSYRANVKWTFHLPLLIFTMSPTAILCSSSTLKANKQERMVWLPGTYDGQCHFPLFLCISRDGVATAGHH